MKLTLPLLVVLRTAFTASPGNFAVIDLQTSSPFFQIAVEGSCTPIATEANAANLVLGSGAHFVKLTCAGGSPTLGEFTDTACTTAATNAYQSLFQASCAAAGPADTALIPTFVDVGCTSSTIAQFPSYQLPPVPYMFGSCIMNSLYPQNNAGFNAVVPATTTGFKYTYACGTGVSLVSYTGGSACTGTAVTVPIVTSTCSFLQTVSINIPPTISVTQSIYQKEPNPCMSAAPSTAQPTGAPVKTAAPSTTPSTQPTGTPTHTRAPSKQPSAAPTQSGLAPANAPGNYGLVKIKADTSEIFWALPENHCIPKNMDPTKMDGSLKFSCDASQNAVLEQYTDTKCTTGKTILNSNMSPNISRCTGANQFSVIETCTIPILLPIAYGVCLTLPQVEQLNIANVSALIPPGGSLQFNMICSGMYGKAAATYLETFRVYIFPTLDCSGPFVTPAEINASLTAAGAADSGLSILSTLELTGPFTTQAEKDAKCLVLLPTSIIGPISAMVGNSDHCQSTLAPATPSPTPPPVVTTTLAPGGGHVPTVFSIFLGVMGFFLWLN